MSCIIGCMTSYDMWTNLKDRFSTVTKASIFQMKTELQNIKKGVDSVSLYLQRIKDARDHLFAAGVFFDDDDVVILALKGLTTEYNTFRTVIRGRDNVISLKDFRAQLLAEEATIENHTVSETFATAMLAQNNTGKGKALMLGDHVVGSSSGGSSYSSTHNSGPSHTANSGGFSNINGGFSNSSFRGRERGRNNFYSNSLFNGFGHTAIQCYHWANFSYQGRPPSRTLTAMHTTYQPSAPQESFWVADTEATSYITSDLGNLTLAKPFPSNETITTASGSDFQPKNLQVVNLIHTVNLHPMQTRSKSRISKKKACSATVQSSVDVIEPSSFKFAIQFLNGRLLCKKK
ncbi:unnamed protein product [Malus baccata var. baccata]